MKTSLFGSRLWLACLIFILLITGCRKTRDFTYNHPKNHERLLQVVISLDSADNFQLTIDGRLVSEKKFDLKPKTTKGWDSTIGSFEAEYVGLFCTRDYISVKSTLCDFSIGSGPKVTVNFD